MGYGRWSDSEATARTATRATAPPQTVFTSRGVHPSLDPNGLTFRESRDSADHPASRMIAFFLDVTKSMQDIPQQLATRTLPDFARRVLPILPDAQILFGAVGDGEDGDRAPLQVGQAESADRLVDQWLTRLFLEGGGGPIGEESYDLALYFLARHVRADGFEKRGLKGYAFLTGDERPRSRVSAAVVNRLFGRRVLEQDIPIERMVAEVAERFHLFFLIPDLRRAEDCAASWRALIGEHAINMVSPDDASLVASELIGLTEGTWTGDGESLFRRFETQGFGRSTCNQVYRAVRPYAASIGAAEPVRPVAGTVFPATRPSGLRRIAAS